MNDHRYHCSDCDNYGLCEYYHRRKSTSLICKEFVNDYKLIEKLKDIRQKIEKIQTNYYGGYIGLDKQKVLRIIDAHIEEEQE